MLCSSFPVLVCIPNFLPFNVRLDKAYSPLFAFSFVHEEANFDRLSSLILRP